MWSSQVSLQNLANRNKRMEALFMLIWSERFWDVDSRQIYSSLNMGKSSPSLWPATRDSCCPCWQYTLSSQKLLMWSSQESLQKFAIRYKRMEALLVLIWSERFQLWTLGKFTHPSLWEKDVLVFDGQQVILVVLVGNIPCLANYLNVIISSISSKPCQQI